MSAAAKSQDGQTELARVYLAACCHSVEDIPVLLRRCFTHEVVLEAPDQDARRKLLEVGAVLYHHTALSLAQSCVRYASHLTLLILQGTCQAHHGSEALHNVAVQTAGLLPADLAAITADAAAHASLLHISLPSVISGASTTSAISEETQLDGAFCLPHSSKEGLAITELEFEYALGEVRRRTAVEIGAPEVCILVAYQAHACHASNLCMPSEQPS